MGKKNQNNAPAASPVGTLAEFNKLEICPAQEDSLKDLNTYLSSKSYIIGYGLSTSDQSVYCKVSNNLDAKKFPHVARWAAFIGSFPLAVRDSWVGDEVDVYDEEYATEGEEEPTKASKNDDDDDSDDSDDSDDMDFDNLGDCDDDDDEETKALMAKHADKIKEIQARQAAKAGKAKTNITIDVNPEDAETDMEEVQEAVCNIEIPGLKWLGEGSIIPTCFGMTKLTIMCQIFDQQVPSTQVIYDAIEAVDGVGSTREIASQMA